MLVKRFRLERHQLALIGEGCIFVFYLIGDAVYLEVSRYGERYTVLGPGLTEMLCHELFKSGAPVDLLAEGPRYGFEVLNRAEIDDCECGTLQRSDVRFCSLVADLLASPTACGVERQRISDDGGGGERHVDFAVLGIAHNVVVRIGVALVNGK